MRDKLIFEKINQAVMILDEIDEMIDTQSSEIQKVDWELSDWLHYIENNDIEEKIAFKIIQRIKELRLIRRSLSNESSIEDTYKNNSSKMMGNNTRQFLIQEIHKTINHLNCDYKNRILTDEDVKKVIEITKRKVGRPRKKKEDDVTNE